MLLRYCKICGKRLYRDGGPLTEATEYNQFNGRVEHLGYGIRLLCEVLNGCGSWYAEKRQEATMNGLYQHVYSVDGLTKNQAESYKIME